MSTFNALVFPKICNGILKAYRNSWPRDLVSLVLCSPVDFHAQSMNWDCGFRNTQSLISSCINNDCLSRDYLFSSGFHLSPRLKELQRKIEKAWHDGFDQIGARQLKYKLLNTNKWIGATEVVALLRFCGLEARVADFDFTNNKMDLNTMLTMIYDYFFSQISSENHSNKDFSSHIDMNNKKKIFVSPLYLQHQGHSRLIFGVEKWASGEIKLLILDPQLRRALQFSYYSEGKCSILRYGCGTYGINSIFKYQIAYLDKNIQNENKHDESRKLIVDELKLIDWDKFENSREKFAYSNKNLKIISVFKSYPNIKNKQINKHEENIDYFYHAFKNFKIGTNYSKYKTYRKVKKIIFNRPENKMIENYTNIFSKKNK
ncbi:hypothetical protein CMESO_497 (nucleomorph) [Chroomonas mesostigmatica CCMP1168]|uniref:UFSP1/2/DUB catalytic domain-containing protein n=1 Tax=Chroomonas mesostigmatica CCMP1168 TaxID=1195612 RepID=J7G6G5_9CRYP|nr:hypothetical protein CMESO_497 [Chroomonas mesostigmatica CCMP1168]|mmetsp:Transcript_17253/g.42128  ORF Transcript_17253/g.42128 Transcript_17253/m.42128 type:complete len:374 (-) Transcript_17253:160-1281(-)